MEEAVAVVAAFDAGRVSALFYFFFMMSTENKEADMMMCCASCGIAQVDDIKLKDCGGGCDLVKYCSDACQENHREDHDEQCRERKAELRDRDLFTMPDGSYLGECPICCLPMSIDAGKNIFMQCCSKIICLGCNRANAKREIEAGMKQRCPFCREPVPESDEEADKSTMRRIKENNDPAAMRFMGKKRYLEGDYGTALEYYTKAAELGDADAQCDLSFMYHDGEGVEKDKNRAIYHLEGAAIAGHPQARHNLGCVEANNGRFERAKKHFIIAANLGYHESLTALRELYAEGFADKEDYAGALRAYQTVVNEAKSAEREEAEAYFKRVAGREE